MASRLGAESHGGSSSAGSVVLDIGGGNGALVVLTGGAPLDSEVEIRRIGENWMGKHTAVHERHVRGHSFRAALFQSLPTGSYELRWRKDPGPGTDSSGEAKRSPDSPTRIVEVLPGVVTETALISNGPD